MEVKSMLRIPENKTRKNLRIAQCLFYLFEIFFCSLTYVAIPNPEKAGDYFYATVLDMIGYIGGNFQNSPAVEAIKSYYLYYLIFLIIPIVGFFFCALDKERNMKNIVSIICCLLGVFSILTIVTLNFINIGSLFALLVYILISFITSIAMMARLTDDAKARKEE